MKCPKCNGSGEIKHDWLPHETCHNCGGTGYVNMTNEEHIQTCNTEQLAEAILQQWIHGAYHGVGEFGLTDKEIESARDDIVEWLKQPYSGE